MNNALHQPQTVVVLGGASDLGRAVVAALASPALRTVVLAGRTPDTIDTRIPGVDESVEVLTVAFDAADHGSHRAVVAGIVDRVGDLDVVVQAFGQLGPDAASDPTEAAALVDTNTTGAVSSGLAVAEVLRRQGHGVLVVLSSVAGVRTRASNFVYGASKAGQDAFATGLGLALHGTGARVLTVRPGMVRTKMTEGMADAPFAVDADAVGEAVASGLRHRRSVVWVPGVLRYVFGLLRFAPDAIWRRIDR